MAMSNPYDVYQNLYYGNYHATGASTFAISNGSGLIDYGGQAQTTQPQKPQDPQSNPVLLLLED